MENVFEISDEELYKNFLCGDTEALDELLIRHKEGLTWFLHGIVKSMDDAEDLMMDSFAILITKRPRFKNDSTFKTWLYGIGRNLAKSHFRKKHIVNEHVDDMPEQYIEHFEKNDILAKIVEAEDKSLLYETLYKLPKDYMSVLYLMYVEQLSVEQISKVMKKNLKQVYNLISRAKNKLKEELK